MKLALIACVLVLCIPTARADDELEGLDILGWTGDGRRPYIADTHELTLAINTRYAADVATHAADVPGWECKDGLVTTRVVSWRCAADDQHVNPAHDPVLVDTLEVVGDKLVPLSLGGLFAPRADLDAQLAKLTGVDDAYSVTAKPCHLPATRTAVVYPTVFDLVVYAGPNTRASCTFKWKDVAPLLVPHSGVALMAAAFIGGYWNTIPHQQDLTPSEITIVKPKKVMGPYTERFVADGADAVIDNQTALEWAARDNGADIDRRSAQTYVEHLRAGGHGDWRIPTLAELTAISVAKLAHKEPKDCTGGKVYYLISPLVHLSCGIVWAKEYTTSTTASALGFITGKPHDTDQWASKNARVLAVRDL